MNQYLAPALTRLGVLASHPTAFVVLLLYVAAWQSQKLRLAIGCDHRHLVHDVVHLTNRASRHTGNSRQT